MHERGEVMRGGERVGTRGSAWIEQEIAIAVFMTHVLDRRLPVLYLHGSTDLPRRIRTLLLLNPRLEFTSEQQVLDDLRRVLPEMQFKRFAELDLAPRLRYDTDRVRTDRHDYMFIVDLANEGSALVTDFRVEVYLPKRFLDGHGLERMIDKQKSSETHFCFVNEVPPNKNVCVYQDTQITAFKVFVFRG